MGIKVLFYVSAYFSLVHNYEIAFIDKPMGWTDAIQYCQEVCGGNLVGLPEIKHISDRDIPNLDTEYIWLGNYIGLSKFYKLEGCFQKDGLKFEKVVDTSHAKQILIQATDPSWYRPDDVFVVTTKTTATCQLSCSEFPYFAIQTEGMLSYHDCNYPCSDLPAGNCGGTEAVTVYSDVSKEGVNVSFHSKTQERIPLARAAVTCNSNQTEPSYKTDSYYSVNDFFCSDQVKNKTRYTDMVPTTGTFEEALAICEKRGSYLHNNANDICYNSSDPYRKFWINIERYRGIHIGTDLDYRDKMNMEYCLRAAVTSFGIHLIGLNNCSNTSTTPKHIFFCTLRFNKSVNTSHCLPVVTKARNDSNIGPTGISLTTESVVREEDLPLIMYQNGSQFVVVKDDGNGSTISKEAYIDVEIGSIAFDIYKDKYIWVDIKQGGIVISEASGENSKVITKPDTLETIHMHVDWIAENIYFLTSATNILEVCSIDGIHRKKLLAVWLVESTASTFDFPVIVLRSAYQLLFTIDPLISHLFIFAYDVIERFGMNVALPQRTRIMSGISAKVATSDFQDNRLYWIDTSGVLSCDPNGYDFHIVIPKLVSMPIAVYRDNLYLYDSTHAKKCNKHNCNSMEDLFYHGVPRWEYGLRFGQKIPFRVAGNQYHPTESYSPCQTTNCSQLCLLSPTFPFFECQCSTGAFLLDDGVSCADKNEYCKDKRCPHICNVVKDYPYYQCDCYDGFSLLNANHTCNGASFLIIYITSSIWRMNLDNSDFNLRKLPIIDHSEGTDTKKISLYFDPVENSLLYLSKEGSVSRFSLVDEKLDMATDYNTLEKRNYGEFIDFAYDWQTKTFYFYWAEVLEILVLDTTTVIKHDFPEIASCGIVAFDTFESMIWMMCLLKFEPDILIHSSTDLSTRYSMMKLEFIYGYTIDVTGGHFYSIRRSRSPTSMGELFKSKLDGSYETVLNEYHSTENKLIMPLLHAYFDEYVYHLQVDLLSARIEFYRSDKQKNIMQIPVDLAGSTDISGVIKGVKVIKPKGQSGMSECESFRKCLTVQRTWICLNISNICDEIIDCYEQHDEKFCNWCPGPCQITKLALSCKKNVAHDKTSARLEAFIGFTYHPFSGFATLSDIIANDCSIEFSKREQISNDTFIHPNYYQITTLSIYHVLRQIIISNIFNNLEGVEILSLSGTGVLKDGLSDLPFYALRNLTELILLDTDLMEFSSERIKGDHLKSLAFRKNSKLRYISDLSLGNMHNLEQLVIVDNSITILTKSLLGNLTRLTSLEVYGKTFVSIVMGAFDDLKSLLFLKVDNTHLEFIAPSLLRGLYSLTSLILTNNRLRVLKQGTLDSQVLLQLFDVRGNDMYVVEKTFHNIENLSAIYSDTYAFCCIKPKYMSDSSCHAPMFDVSSCTDLIESLYLRIFLWILGLIALFGNAAVVIYRYCCVSTGEKKDSFSVFVTNLGISDMLMGFYMLIIATADALFAGNYVIYEYQWRHGLICKVSGTVAFISCEFSAILICLISIDRYLIVKYPFGEYRISIQSASLTSIVGLIVSIVLGVIAGVLYPDYYSRSGVCIALPLQGQSKSGLEFSLAVFLGFNTFICVAISVFQFLIFMKVREQTKEIAQVEGENIKVKVAKRLSVIVFTDLLCWIPVGVLVLLWLYGIETSREIYALVVVFILPVNSAINPLIYTLWGLKIQKPACCKRKYKAIGETNGPFILREDRTSSSAPVLSNILMTRSLCTENMYRIAYDLSKVLAQIHRRCLYHGCVDEEHVWLNINNQVIEGAVLMKTVAESLKSSTPSDDIEEFGKMLKRLLRTQSSKPKPSPIN